jgi:DNA-binding MarR family transcriptional regulator
VLVTLARIDDGRGVSQRRLMDELGLTFGTVAVRMDRLVAEGLVDRRADTSSARNTLISPTDRGQELFERVALWRHGGRRRAGVHGRSQRHRCAPAVIPRGR